MNNNNHNDTETFCTVETDAVNQQKDTGTQFVETPQGKKFARARAVS